VDLNRFRKIKKGRARKRKERGISPDTLVVGYVGWLIPIKGVTFLISAMAEAVQQYSNSLLVLVGKGDEEGEEEAKLREQVKKLGLTDKVIFLGWRADVDEIMGCFDLFVLPSLNEGMGRVLVEAMAVGLPIVASDVGGIPDLVKDGNNGFLVPPSDADALKHAILDLLKDEAKRKRMGEVGKEMCRSYSTEAMVEQINGLYTKLIEENSYNRNSRVRFLLDKHNKKLEG
jgi:glycosyltransferase involved in cell wall biosynthesis